MNKKNKNRILALKKDMKEIFSNVDGGTCSICKVREICRIDGNIISRTTPRTVEIMNIVQTCPFVGVWMERILFPNKFNYVMGNKFMTVFEAKSTDYITIANPKLLLTSEGKLIYSAWNTYYAIIPPMFREFFVTNILRVLPELEPKIKHWSIAKRKSYFEKYIKSKKNG